MSNSGSTANRGTMVLIAAVALILAGTQMFAGRAQADEAKSTESDSTTTENDHHYQSAAERANDALLITEVKSALADDGVADGSAILVDCDHAKILLTGVMKSAADAKRAGSIAASAPGVVAVKNQLTWH
jgi:osmotically-inducible protein OsmY